jgi:hypothetical protein
MNTAQNRCFSLLAVLVFVSIGAAHAQTLNPTQTTDITVNNGISTSPSNFASIAPSTYGANPGGDFNTNPDLRTTGPSNTPVLATGYVNHDDVPDKIWDLEAFGYQSSSQLLTYVGGFNPLAPNVDSGTSYSLGDIFISTGPVTQTGSSINTNSPAPYNNPGYSYAVHFTATGPSTLSYTIYQLTTSSTPGQGSQVLTVGGQPGVNDNNFENNGESDPYALDLNANGTVVGGGTAVATGTATVALDTNAQVNSLLDENLFYEPGVIDNPTADNYVVSFDLSSLDLSSFGVSLTEQCGNDLMDGESDALTTTTATPEPKSIFLAFLATAFFLGGVSLKRHYLRD